MSASAEARMPGSGPDGPLAGGWREAAAQAQRPALPRGRVVVSCKAPFGVGGLGRHLREIVDALAAAEQPATCICDSTRASSSGTALRSARHMLGIPYLTTALRTLPIPSSVGVRALAAALEFDAYAA